jgi:hypothetical protein
MSFSFTSLVRILVLLALATTTLAIGVSKLDPPRPERRTIHHANYMNVNEYFLGADDHVPRWLDSETGRIGTHATEDGDPFEMASSSPWVDEKGRNQVIGRWSTRTKDGPMAVTKDFGLARYLFPSGELLDHVSTETVPVSPPCWFPGTRARVIFSGGDGKLYHFAFEPEPYMKELDADAKGDLEPRPVIWRCPMPGEGNVFVSELNWPEDPRLAGCLVVSLREQATNSSGARYLTQTRFWWLKLNLAGTEVVDAGRLLESDDSSSDRPDLRSPVVGTLADGRLLLAYLIENPAKPTWSLRVVPIELVGDHQVPKARESESQLIRLKCHPTPTIFSADGRWLNVLVDPENKSYRITRLPTDRFFKD